MQREWAGHMPLRNVKKTVIFNMARQTLEASDMVNATHALIASSCSVKIGAHEAGKFGSL